MKIALICTEKLPVPPIAGGAIQLYIDNVVPYLSKQHEVTVYCIQHPGLPNEEVKDDVRYIRVEGKSRTTYLNNLKSKLSEEYDLIHVFNRPLFLLALSEALPKTKFSLSLHNEMFYKEKISDEAGLRCIEKAEFINTVSQYIANTVIQRFPAASSKMNVVYSAVDASKYHPYWTEEGARIKEAIKLKYGLEHHRVIIYVGRLSVKKGVHVLLRAMENVMASHKNVALVIVGSKWYGKNELDDYTKSILEQSRKLSGPVIFTGFVTPSEISKYYSMGDVFVCASQWNEPLARVHYEAMAAGLPFITTNRGGNAEIAEGFGNGIVLNEYNDPTVMAENICYLLDNPDKALEMGIIGRKLAEKEFHWERVANEMLSKFQTVAEVQAMTVPIDEADIKADDHNVEAADEVIINLGAKTEAGVDTEATAETETITIPEVTAETEAEAETWAYDHKTEDADELIIDLEDAPAPNVTTAQEAITAPEAEQPLNISIIGTGYVGLVTGACLATMGMNVYCCDSDATKISNLKKGVLPIYEPVLDSLVDSCVNKSKRLHFISGIKEAVDLSDIIFITVNTPTLAEGTCDTGNVFEAAHDIAHYMDSYKLIINKSTVPLGTGRKMKNLISKILLERNKRLEFDVVSNPEFLREGSAVEDFINPDRIVIGADNDRAVSIMKTIYRDQIMCNIPTLITGIDAAEMIKYASNAFLATKISFINEIANICELCSIDVKTVTKGMGMDKRIGNQFLNPGPGFGGSCFPKDVRALAGLSREHGFIPRLLNSVLEVNERQKMLMVEKINRVLGGLEGRRISVLGLAFKPGTDDIRESPSLTILAALLEQKARVSVYDPQAMDNLKRNHPEMDLRYCKDVYSACSRSVCTVLLTEWDEFSSLDFKKLKAVMKNPVLLDLRNMYDPGYVKSFGFYYEGVGKR